VDLQPDQRVPRIEAQNKDLAAKIAVDNTLKGTKDQIASNPVHGVRDWNFSKNIDAARWFLMDYSERLAGTDGREQGVQQPIPKGHQQKPMAGSGHGHQADSPAGHRQLRSAVGYPARPRRRRYDALNNHHVTDMFANFITGKKSIDDTIADAKKRLQDSLTKCPAVTRELRTLWMRVGTTRRASDRPFRYFSAPPVMPRTKVSMNRL